MGGVLAKGAVSWCPWAGSDALARRWRARQASVTSVTAAQVRKGYLAVINSEETTMTDRQTKQTQSNETAEMTDAQLDAVSGGTLSSMISEVMKNFGGALQTAARG